MRDSSGVIIVTNTAFRLDSASRWHLSDQAKLQIGGQDATGGSALYRVSAAVRLTDGRIVAVDGGSEELRFFDASGTYVKAAGGEGDGPGEFKFINGLFVLPGDSLLVLDYGSRRMTIFDAQGKLGRMVTQDETLGGFTYLGQLEDGSLLESGPVSRTSEPESAGVRWSRAEVIRVGAPGIKGDSTLKIVEYDASESLVGESGGRRMMAAFPFMRSRRPVFDGARIVLADNTDYELRYYAPDGTLRRIVRRVYQPHPIGSEELATAEKATAKTPFSDLLKGVDLPKTRPTFGSVITDRLGNLWVQRYRPYGTHGPDTWSVFDTDGTWTTDVVMPASFKPMDIGADYVLGVSTDDLGVERVQLYGLTRGAQKS